MLTREQKYASYIFPQIQSVNTKDIEFKKKYRTMAQKLPMLIRTAGLAQALAFLEAKVDSEPAWKCLCDHLTSTVTACVGIDDLLQKSRQAPLQDYTYVTQQVLQALLWYKRLAESELDIDETTGT